MNILADNSRPATTFQLTGSFDLLSGGGTFEIAGSLDGKREAMMADKTLRTSKRTPEQDAKGQSEKDHKGGGSDGVASADPRVISGKKDGDATFPVKGPKK
ncbi:MULTISPECIES: hypothetical protein [unclassified Mesorhizobium]|uniref:hypothetical protein n=3 Tax=unclassified Mesorhizobium TaxID=325217 RepID=UPI0012DE026B|nr:MULTISPECIES: hypothetical protein [unclassified Mesorhizobium]WJI59830.1 hypothetical protein NLY33_14430 [Mesorhizobium sp. C432A]